MQSFHQVCGFRQRKSGKIQNDRKSKQNECIVTADSVTRAFHSSGPRTQMNTSNLEWTRVWVVDNSKLNFKRSIFACVRSKRVWWNTNGRLNVSRECIDWYLPNSTDVFCAHFVLNISIDCSICFIVIFTGVNGQYVIVGKCVDNEKLEAKKTRVRGRERERKTNPIYFDAVSFEWTRPEYFMQAILWPSLIIRWNEIFREEERERALTYRRTDIFYRCHCRQGNEKNHTETSSKMVLHHVWMSLSCWWPNVRVLLVAVAVDVVRFDRLTFYLPNFFFRSTRCEGTKKALFGLRVA